MKDAAKKFGKKFACGASVVDEAGGAESIEMQGDIAETLAEFIVGEYPDVNASQALSSP